MGKNELSEDSPLNTSPTSNPSKSERNPIWQIGNEESFIESNESTTTVNKVDFDRLYSDSAAYNENLKIHQSELLVSEMSYQKSAFNLSSYGISNGVYGYISGQLVQGQYDERCSRDHHCRQSDELCGSFSKMR